MSPRDLARFGWLYLHQGRWRNVRLLESSHIALAIGSPLPGGMPTSALQPAETLELPRPLPAEEFAPSAYGSYSFGWWTNGDDAAGGRLWPDGPRDAFAAIGNAGEEVLLVAPSLDLVIAFTDGRPTGWSPGVDNPVNQVLRQVLAAVVREESSQH